MNPSGKQYQFDRPGIYRIYAQGQLSVNWSSRLCDMVITVSEPPGELPVTTLTGEVRDQTALMGVLSALYDMGCPLLKVDRIESASAAEITQADEARQSE